MDKFGIRFKEERKKKNLTQQDLATLFHLDKSSISKYENGHQRPEMETLINICDYFGVSVEYLVGQTDKKEKNINKTDVNNITNLIEIDNNKMVKIPVLGAIKAGIPMFAEDNIIGYEYVHQEELMQGEKYFYLQVKGDSMINARIYEGDRVRIKKQNFIERNGDIMAVRVNGDEATLKRVYKQENGLVLISENPNYFPIFFPASDIEVGYVSIIGKVVKIEINVL